MKKRYHKLINITILLNSHVFNLLELELRFLRNFQKKIVFFIKNSNSFLEKKSFRPHLQTRKLEYRIPKKRSKNEKTVS